MALGVYTIYKATNTVNGKAYIGFAKDLSQRKRDHKYNALVAKAPNKFYKAIRKYGWDAFTWEILYQSYECDHTLNVMEPHFITEYNTRANGYNLTDGGEGTPGIVVSQAKRISQSQKMMGNNYASNLVHTEEHKAWLSERYAGEKNPMYGRKHSVETKEKIRQARLKRITS